MKSILALTLTSTALTLGTVTVAQAEPPPERIFSPGQLQYFEKRAAIIAQEAKEEEAKRGTRTAPTRPAYLPWAPPVFTPEQLRYWEARDAALAKELSDRPMKDTAMQWLEQQTKSQTP